ncbi:TRAP transporter large permease [Bordetella petrii]|uniref:TRAP transporter large permease n=1 Tax=Bordetella petrii TaxID=94624 RepID=UPI001E4D6542|nr:TRAP transporter large permease [Bordetella petrii]MCD0502300.1 TRAP transporter large permease [Bordetella petrii]
MSTTAWILSVGFACLVMLGVPFVFSIGLVVTAVLVVADVPFMLLPQTVVAGTQSFSLLGIPFFMLAGELMSAGGLSRRLIAVADVCVRHLLGGLGHVTIFAACIFAAISGSAPATTAAIGGAMIPAMGERGYSRPYATSLAVSAGVLAPLIPPSIAFIIWGVIAEQSIASLFLAGIIPGLLMAVGLSAIVIWRAHRDKVPRLPRASAAEVAGALRKGVWALLAPIIVLGGIYGGIFTPTEAAAVVCLYSLIVGLFIEKELRLSQLPAVLLKAMKISSVVMGIVAVSGGMGVLIAQEQFATRFAEFLDHSIQQQWIMLLTLNLGFFLLAAVMDEIALMLIFGPMLIAIGHQFGIDPIHFGAMIVTNVAIGMATPPVGYCLFVGAAVSGERLTSIAKAIWPQIVVMVLVLMLVTYVPAFSLYLVR